MVSKIQIANTALLRLGADPIVSFDDNTPAANIIRNIYDQMVDEVLLENAWASATFRVQLAPLASVPVIGYTNSFSLPRDPYCLQVLNYYIGGQMDTDPSLLPFAVEGSSLLCNTSEAYIKYIGRITDANDYGPFVTKVLISRLALELCYGLTGKESLVGAMTNRYQDDLDAACAGDGQQGSSQITSSVSNTWDR